MELVIWVMLKLDTISVNKFVLDPDFPFQVRRGFRAGRREAQVGGDRGRALERPEAPGPDDERGADAGH